jgi:hypothetical protein
MKISLALHSFIIVFLLSACNGFAAPSKPPFDINESRNSESLELDWSVVFQQELEESYWNLGVHYYQFNSDCPEVEFLGDLQGNLLHFSVKEDVLHSDLIADKYVDLTFDTIGVNYDGYTILSSIQKLQKTRFRFGYKDLTLEQAEFAANNCQVNVIIDRAKNTSLFPVVQQTEFWHRGYYERH